MDAFEATLKRAFAEAPEAVDEAFVVAVGHSVARKEKLAGVLAWSQAIGLAIGMMAAASGVLLILASSMPQVMASLGLEAARAHGSLLSASSFSLSSAGAAGLTQMLFVLVALAGGAAVYRANQQQ